MTHGTHRTHTRDTRHTLQYSGGTIFTFTAEAEAVVVVIDKDAPKKVLELSTTLGCRRKSHCCIKSVVVPVMYRATAEASRFADRRVR